MKEGDIVKLTRYAKVKNVVGDSVEAKDLDGPETFTIEGCKLLSFLDSADDYAADHAVSKTVLSNVLSNAGDKPFTVCFIKQNGELRKLRGRLFDPNTGLGRSIVEDLDIPEEDRFREVDHRTIQSLIIDNVKYTRKK